MKHLKYSLPAFLMTVIIIIIGCAKKEVLLTIGDEKYTVQDFKNRMSFAPTEDSLKRMQKVNDFINEMLVIHEARAQNYENDPVVTAALETNRKDIIARGYYEAQVIDKIKISDYDAQKKYEDFINQYHLAEIVVPAESLADFIDSELKKGVPFEELVKYSLDTLTKGGDIGSFPVAQLPPEIYESIKKAKIGMTTEPIRFGNYYYILKVIEHKKLDTPKFNDVKESIKSGILREKALKQGENFTNELIARANIEYNDEGFAILIKPDSLLTENDLNTWLIKRIKKNDTSYVRVRTIVEAIQYQYQRSNIDPKVLVQRALLPDLVYDEAIERGADRYPKIKADLKKALATLLYQKYYSDAVIEKVNIDSAMVKAYYLSHPEDYKDKKLNEVYTLILSKIRSDIVDTLRNNLFAELRNKYNPILNEELLKSILKENK